MIIGQMNTLSDDRRYELLYGLFPGKWSNIETVTTKELTDQEWNGLYHWALPYKDEEGDGKWHLHPSVMLEIENSFSWPQVKHLTEKAMGTQEFDKGVGLDELPEYQQRMVKDLSEAMFEEPPPWGEDDQKTMDLDE